MSSLARLQHGLQAFVLDADPSAQKEIVGSTALGTIERLGIYGEAYRLRLIEALASNYPRLKEAVGTQDFESIALRYIEAHRSSRPSIRWYGDRLAHFIATHRSEDPWLGELAHWEWAIASAFDAPDAAVIGAAALASVRPEQWSDLRLKFHPSLQRLDLHSNAVAIFKAFTEERAAPEPQAEPTTTWVIWRQELKTQYRSLPADEAAILDLMRAQGSFAQACELLCDWHAAEQVPLRAAGYMQQWLHDAFVCALDCQAS